jgi:hypothetical protein
MKLKNTFTTILVSFLIFFAGSHDGFAQAITYQDSNATNTQSLFPLMHKFKQKAIEAGAEFPKPYGIAGSMYFQQQQMEITKIRLGALELSEDNGVIDFDNSSIRNTVISSQVRADMWVLPFVNIYGMLGRVNSFNDIDLTINLNPPPGSPSQGEINLLRENSIAGITGTVAGFGTVVAGGYGNMFANVNITWAQSWLDEVNSIQKSFVAFPMVGTTTKLANLFVGAIYQNLGQVNKGTIGTPGGQQLNYELEFSAQKWNYCVGFNKQIGHWSMVMMQGFGARTNSVVEVGYRFGK